MISIEDKMIAIGTTNQELSKKLNLNPSTISRFLSGKSEMKFESLFQLIQTIYDIEEQHEVCRFYFQRLHNKRNIKCALEFFATNKDFKEILYLMEREKNTTNSELKELLPIYGILYKVLHLKQPISVAVKNTEGLYDFTTKEGQAFQKVMRLYPGVTLKHHSFIYEGKDDAYKTIEELDDSYFKQSLKNRVNEMMIWASIHRNKLEEAKQYITDILNNFTCFYYKAYAYYYLSKIESVNSFENSIKHLNTSVKLWKLINNEEGIRFANTRLLPFIHIFHKKDSTEYPNLLYLDTIKAYFLFKKGNIKESQELFDKSVNKNEFFYYLVKAIIYDDINLLWLSLIHFLNIKDTFYIKLPVQRLLEKGVKIEDMKEILNGNGLNVM